MVSRCEKAEFSGLTETSGLIEIAGSAMFSGLEAFRSPAMKALYTILKLSENS